MGSTSPSLLTTHSLGFRASRDLPLGSHGRPETHLEVGTSTGAGAEGRLTGVPREVWTPVVHLSVPGGGLKSPQLSHS